MKIRSNKELLNHVNRGKKAKYLFFWGHQKPKSGVNQTCFSQWYSSSFKVEGENYSSAEHFMMAEKARLFGDTEIRLKILTAKNPGEAKQLGRNVSGFKDDVWINHRFEIVVAANLAKFGQNADLKEYLLNTGERVLVEASPVDKIWGIGLAADHDNVEKPNLWKGLNLLGYALMEVREQLSKAE